MGCGAVGRNTSVREPQARADIPMPALQRVQEADRPPALEPRGPDHTTDQSGSPTGRAEPAIRVNESLDAGLHTAEVARAIRPGTRSRPWPGPLDLFLAVLGVLLLLAGVISSLSR